MLKNLFFAAFGVLVISSVSVRAAGIEGDAKGPGGAPLKGMGVRAERQDKHGSGSMAKTDAKGHFAFQNLAVGAYKVDLMNNGQVSSTARVSVRAGTPTFVKFDLNRPSTSTAAAKTGKGKTKTVWVPAETGSNLGGHWVQVEEGDNVGPSGQKVRSTSGESQRSLQDINNVSGASGR